jgi:hypothetical protein
MFIQLKLNNLQSNQLFLNYFLTILKNYKDGLYTLFHDIPHRKLDYRCGILQML